MQGTFKRPRTAGQKLDAIPEDLLRHPRGVGQHERAVTAEEQQVYTDAVDQAQAEADAENTNNGYDENDPNFVRPVHIPEPQPQEEMETVHPPPQTFMLNSKTYYIIPYGPAFETRQVQFKYYWTVPYIQVEEQLDLNNPNTKQTYGKPFPVQLLVKQDEDPDNNDPLHLLKNKINTPASKDIFPLPHPTYAEYLKHYVLVDPASAAEISYPFLQRILDSAEKSEYDFAVRMQGLLNCTLNAVWTCTDFGFDTADRGHIMEQFLQKYIGRFLSQVSQKPEEIQPDAIVAEALQMHSRFSSRWTKEHKRGLSPSVDASSEALVSSFTEGPLKFLVSAGFTRMEIARFLRRDPVLSPQFGLCLNFFMVKLDQDRSGRNANYKSMFNANASNLLQIKTLGAFLQAQQGYMHGLLVSKGLQDPNARLVEPLTMDWYYVVSQLHAPTVQYTGVRRPRASSRAVRNPARDFFGSA
jgi:hypothetical protein